MDGLYVMNPEDSNSLYRNVDGEELPLEAFSLAIQDGQITVRMKTTNGTSWWDPLCENCGSDFSYTDSACKHVCSTVTGELQYNAETNQYYVSAVRDSNRTDQYYFSWSETYGITMVSGGCYGESRNWFYALQNVNKPLKKFPLIEFDGSYSGIIDPANNDQNHLAYANMDIAGTDVHLDFASKSLYAPFDLLYFDFSFDIVDHAIIRYYEKDGQNVFHIHGSSELEADIYLFEDGTVKTSWQHIESRNPPAVKELIMERIAIGPEDYNANIIGNGFSNTNEYAINIVGNIQATLNEGANILAYNEVQSQNLSINTFNLLNGANRVMGISTVEKISVTVTKGVITNIEIVGRVQTNPGNFDRYTVNCNTI